MNCVFFARSYEFALVAGRGHGLCGSLYARHGVTQERGSLKYETSRDHTEGSNVIWPLNSYVCPDMN